MSRRLPRPRQTGRLISSPLMPVEYRPRFYSDPRPWQLTIVPPGFGARYATDEIERDALMVEGFIYAGHDSTRPHELEEEQRAEFRQREDAPQDYAWRALGDHIASGLSDVPQTVQARVFINGRWVGAQAVLSYVELDDMGDLVPLDDDDVAAAEDALHEDLVAAADGDPITWETAATRLVARGWRRQG